MNDNNQNDKALIKNHLFIIGIEKVGTTLLLSLLDDHPQLFSIPFELKYHKLFNSVSKNDRCELSCLNDLFLEQSKMVYMKKKYHIDQYSTGKINFEKIQFDRVKNYLFNLPEKSYTRSEYLAELGFSIMEGLGEKKTAEFLITKHVNNSLDCIEQIFDDFPECKIVHLVRDPKDTLAATKISIKKYKGSWGEYNCGDLLRGIKKGFDVAISYSKDKRYKVIKFEELVRNTEGTMRNLAEFLGISYEKCLLNPSILGVPWSGNSSSDQQFEGVSNDPIGRATGSLSPKEIDLTELLLRNHCHFFGYSLKSTRISTARTIYLKLVDYHILPKIAYLMKYPRKLVKLNRYPYYFKTLTNKIFGFKL